MKTHCFRLKRGQDLMLSLKEYAEKSHLKAGVILSAVGCIINTTAEIVILELDKVRFSSEFDEETGYQELVIKEQ